MEKLKKCLSNEKIYIPIYIIFIIFTCYITSVMYFDNDGYFIVASGNYILKYGIPKINPFTMVKDLQIIIQQWPWAIYCAWIYNKIGNMGLYLSCLVLYFLNLFAFRYFAKLKKSNRQLSTIIIMLVLAFSYQFITIRPTLLTTLLLILQLCVLEKYKQTDNKLVLLWLPIISFLEINIHSAIWFFHFVFMLPYLVPPIKNPFIKFQVSDIKRMPLLISMIPMALVGFLNPYGIDGIKYITYSFGDQLKDAGIQELQCFKLNSFWGLVILISLAIICYILLKNKNREISAEMFYLFCGCSIMGFMYIRNLIYFLFGIICISIELLSYIDNEKIESFLGRQKKYTCMLAWVAATCILCIFPSEIPTNVNAELENTSLTPVNAISYLEENHVSKDTNIFTTFNNGGYFEFCGYKCFVDARPELYFKSLNKKDEVFKDYSSLEDNTDIKTYEEFLEKYQFEYLCINRSSMFDTYMQTNSDYEIVLQEDEYNLYKTN